MLYVLTNKLYVDLDIIFFIQGYHLRQVFPTSRRNERFSVNRTFYAVKIRFLNFKIGKHRGMNARLVSVFFPRCKIRLDVNSFQSVPRYNVKLTDGIIVFGRISRSDYYPAVRHSVSAKHLVLQELEHNRGERF